MPDQGQALPKSIVVAFELQPALHLLRVTLKSHTQDPVTFKLNATPDSSSCPLPGCGTQANIGHKELPFLPIAKTILVRNSLTQYHGLQQTFFRSTHGHN